MKAQNYGTISQNTTLSSNVFVSNENILIVGDNRPNFPQNKLIMIGNILLSSNTFDLTYFELRAPYAFNVIYTRHYYSYYDESSGKRSIPESSGKLNINIIDTNTNISYSPFFDSVTSTQSYMSLADNSIWLGSLETPPINFPDLYYKIYDKENPYTFNNSTGSQTVKPIQTIVSPPIPIQTFFIDGSELQTNKQNYSNYITNLITMFTKSEEYTSVYSPSPSPSSISYSGPSPSSSSDSNSFYIIIGVIIAICIIIIIIFIFMIRKNKKNTKLNKLNVLPLSTTSTISPPSSSLTKP